LAVGDDQVGALPVQRNAERGFVAHFHRLQVCEPLCQFVDGRAAVLGVVIYQQHTK
jgi:hypothetical protein